MWTETGEKVVTEDDGSGSTQGMSGEVAESGVEDANVATVGVGAVLVHTTAFTAAAVEDGSGVTAGIGRAVTRDGA